MTLWCFGRGVKEKDVFKWQIRDWKKELCKWWKKREEIRLEKTSGMCECKPRHQVRSYSVKPQMTDVSWCPLMGIYTVPYFPLSRSANTAHCGWLSQCLANQLYGHHGCQKECSQLSSVCLAGGHHPDFLPDTNRSYVPYSRLTAECGRTDLCVVGWE